MTRERKPEPHYKSAITVWQLHASTSCQSFESTLFAPKSSGTTRAIGN